MDFSKGNLVGNENVLPRAERTMLDVLLVMVTIPVGNEEEKKDEGLMGRTVMGCGRAGGCESSPDAV